MAVIAGIVHPDRVKGDIADDRIEKVVGIARLLEPLDLNFCFWIELPCYLPDTVSSSTPYSLEFSMLSGSTE